MELFEDHFVIEDMEVHFSGGLDDHNLNDVTIDLALESGTQNEIKLSDEVKRKLKNMLLEEVANSFQP